MAGVLDEELETAIEVQVHGNDLGNVEPGGEAARGLPEVLGRVPWGSAAHAKDPVRGLGRVDSSRTG